MSLPAAGGLVRFSAEMRLAHLKAIGFEAIETVEPIGRTGFRTVGRTSARNLPALRLLKQFCVHVYGMRPMSPEAFSTYS